MISIINNRVLVDPTKVEEKTQSGLIIATMLEQSQYTREIFSNQGKVVKIASDVKLVKEGDEILFYRWGATEINIDGKDYLLVPEKDILARIEDENAQH